jgi:hypothetical protein
VHELETFYVEYSRRISRGLYEQRFVDVNMVWKCSMEESLSLVKFQTICTKAGSRYLEADFGYFFEQTVISLSRRLYHGEIIPSNF